MGKLIIDGNSVFEIDEECYKKKKVPKECDIEKYMIESAEPEHVTKHMIKKKENDI